MSKKLEKRYGIFRIGKEGNLEGYIEQSFSMGWSRSHVRAFTEKDLNYHWYKKSHEEPDLSKYDHEAFIKKNPSAFVIRITSNFPVALEKKLGYKVEILWKEREKILNRTDEEQKEKYFSKKTHYRNVGFLADIKN